MMLVSWLLLWIMLAALQTYLDGRLDIAKAIGRGIITAIVAAVGFGVVCSALSRLAAGTFPVSSTSSPGRWPYLPGLYVLLKALNFSASCCRALRHPCARADAGSDRRRVLDARPPVRRRRRLLDRVLPRPLHVIPGEEDSRRDHRNTTGRPVIAQMIGNDVRGTGSHREIPAAVPLRRSISISVARRRSCIASARAAGCCARPERIDAILGALRDAVQIKFTVKTRLGFASTEEFDRLLSIFAKHSLDALTVHARTVAQLYRLPVHYDASGRPSRPCRAR
jgi:hypothetical protein